MFSLICARINGRVNNSEAGDLRRHRAHCDVIVMRYGRKSDISLPHLTPSVAYMSVNWVSIGSDNGLSPVRREAIT